ncbi:MAG: transcription elongation factor GreA [Prevotella sp.]|nr:transcription elongation factor GreA [Prevotella sp.]
MEFMSKEGYDKLVAELHDMITVQLPKAIDAVSEARDKGDLSENYEYRAARREHSRLLGRIRFKQNVLSHARVLDSSRLNADSVQLLSSVTLVNLATNRTMTYTIVSPHEANLKEGKISIKSPIARALLNKRKGATVEVRVPAGVLKLRIDDICVLGD